MATECTVICDAKSDGGIIGLTRKEPALLRWTLNQHVLGEYRYAMRDRSGQNATKSSSHEQTLPAAMTRDEKHVQAIVEEITTNMTDPFDTSSHPPGVLINISTGLHASDAVQASLLGERSATGGELCQEDAVVRRNRQLLQSLAQIWTTDLCRHG